MPSIVPFVNSRSDWRTLARTHRDNGLIRVTPLSLKARPAGPQRVKELWVDAMVDGFNRKPNSQAQDWEQWMSQVPGVNAFRQASFPGSPDKRAIRDLAHAVLDLCNESEPAWLSVPQLPLNPGLNTNKVNRYLAAEAASWVASVESRPKLVLPIIITHKDLYMKKTQRNKIVSAASGCLARSGANGYWIVDSDLEDQKGAGDFPLRFRNLISLHEEIAEEADDGLTSFGGPYWCLNLVLWTRGIIDRPAAGVGTSYRYHIAGGTPHKPKVRVALPPLRRLAIVRSDARAWLRAAIRSLPSKSPVGDAFAELDTRWDALREYNTAKLQVATYYKSWFDELQKCPAKGRKLLLYQQLSSAFVLGKSIEATLDGEGTARRPEKIAEQHMLNCL